MAMTLEDRRKTMVDALRYGKGWMTAYAEAFVDQYVEEAHLTQPAQAVDVGAINSVIVDLEERARNGGDAYPDEFESWASALTRALPNANGKEGES